MVETEKGVIQEGNKTIYPNATLADMGKFVDGATGNVRVVYREGKGIVVTKVRRFRGEAARKLNS